MTREIKLALILGSALALVVGVLVSDHLSAARTTRIVDIQGEYGAGIANTTKGVGGPKQTKDDLSHLIADLRPVKIEPPKPEPAPQLEPKTSVAIADPNDALIEHARRNGVPLEKLAATDPVRTGAADPQSAVAAVREHVVAEGDTLWTIAQRYYGAGWKFTRIEEANKEALAVKHGLSIGQKLRIPDEVVQAAPAQLAVAKPEDPAATALKDPAKDPAKDKSKYVVKQGDTLVTVARKTLGSDRRWEEILALNSSKIADPDSLSVGTELRIPQR